MPKRDDGVVVCKDCVVEHAAQGYLCIDDIPKSKIRATPMPGPRCLTHHRLKRLDNLNRERQNRDVNVFGLEPGDYDRLLARQGGKCAICQRSTGRTRRLSVDHDHATGLVRGLLCRPCNTLVGRARDAEDFFLRAAQYLRDPPASDLQRYVTHGQNERKLTGSQGVMV